jgi:hypothetical protein
MKRLIWYGWCGLATLVIAEVLMVQRVPPVAQWFTPIMWSGYILLADALVLRLRGASLIHDRPREFMMMLWLSILCWLVFEVYNIRLKNWYYIGVPPEPWLRNLAYGWSFATIFPSLFETADLLSAAKHRWSALGFPRRLQARPRRMTPVWLSASFLIGLACVAIPPLLPDDLRLDALPAPLPRYMFAFIWLGFILLLEPINYRLGAPSLYRDWEQGYWGRTARLLLAGVLCGFLWEFWNYWAIGKWIYAVPPPLDFGPRIFEMPLIGFLGFPPFALECFSMYQFAKHILQGDRLWLPRGKAVPDGSEQPGR